MIILVVNCGSSSLKYQLINMENEAVMAKGLVERIGIEGSMLKHSPAGKDSVVFNVAIPDHKVAIKLVLDALVDSQHGVIKSLDEIDAIGHRVVHGGEKFCGSMKIDDSVMRALQECSVLAPLHNPPNIFGIEACQKLMPNTPEVAVFDTAFHQTMPKYAYMYALPYSLYAKYGVRRYGFHGTSHRFVSQVAVKMLGGDAEKLRVITCHLGNGASVAAVKGGKCVDTSMGLTPLEGLVMGTRCGDMDPAVIPFVMKKEGITIEQMDKMINKESGVLGVSGVSSDFRDLEAAAEKGNERAKLALDMFAYRVRKYIGAYAAAMGGVDAIVFTAGLGENSAEMRADICKGLEFLGVEIDDAANHVRGKNAVVSAADSKVKVLLIPTNEELMIARDTRDICSK